MTAARTMGRGAAILAAAATLATALASAVGAQGAAPPVAAVRPAAPARNGAAVPDDDALGRAMRDEMDRSMKELKLGQFDRPYFIAYRVSELRWLDASAAYGSLLGSEEYRMRMLTVELRVGDYKFDNTNFGGGGGMIMIGGGGGGGGFGGGGQVPLDDDYLAIRRQIWLATDGAYKEAVEAIAAKRASLLNRSHTDTLSDFTREQPTQTTDEVSAPAVARADAEALVRALSGVPELARLNSSEVSLHAASTRTRYLNSEGTTYTTSRPLVTLTARGSTQAPDGMPFASSVTFFGRSLDGLPQRDRLLRQMRTFALQMDSLRNAPLVERYNGPVLAESDAAAELFREAFASQLVARRRFRSSMPEMSDMIDRSTRAGEMSFTDRLGGRVLPEFLRVVDDPSLQTYAGRPLLGGYVVDDEGVPGRRKVLVESGILKGLLTTRTPVEDLPPNSSGNRRGGGASPSNLLLESDGGLSDAELKARLIAMVQKRGLPYGMLVRKLGGGPDAVAGRGGGERGVLLAYKVFPDGREQLVRAARLARVGVESFKDVVAASRAAGVYHTGGTGGGMEGFYGPSIRGVVSYAVPALLFDDLSITKPQTTELPKPPLISPPQ